MKGRKLKPKNLLLIEKGKVYGEQKERIENEPKPKEIKPKCPKYLTHEQKKEWKRYAKILDACELLNIANAPLLELLAVNSDNYKKCLLKVNEQGLIIYSEKGFPGYNPFWSAQNKCEDQIKKCLSDLGLSSIGMAKIGSLIVKSKKEKNEFEEMLD